ERQSVEDLLWIRHEFLNSTADFGRIVVHGHTPSERPEVLPNRINIDTGAFATGRLTCVVLGSAQPRFLDGLRKSTRLRGAEQVGHRSASSSVMLALKRQCETTMLHNVSPAASSPWRRACNHNNRS